MRIGVDIMGSDSSPEELYQGVLAAAEEGLASDTLVVFVEKNKALELQKIPLPQQGSVIEMMEVSQEIVMDDSPLLAIRQKRDSSLLRGIDDIKERKIDAFVSAGNTGALIAAATVRLKKLPGIQRPALMTVLPSERGGVAILDVGGHTTFKPQHLVQFARMGAAYQRCKGIEKPRVGLLNIGVEALKGTAEMQKVYHGLVESSQDNRAMTFEGNVEGVDVFRGKVDVLVTDGFTGNVFLKTAEGVSAFILERIKNSFSNSSGSEDLQKALSQLKKHVNYDEYPGAIVCGIDGVVIKCHGYSSSRAMKNGVLGALEVLRADLIDNLRISLS